MLAADRRLKIALVFAPAVLMFALGALSHIDTPGLYMDAVNPDYLVVRVLGASSSFPVWALPGTLVFGRFPVLGQIYHGALSYWLGLPIYALFGTGMIGVRVANMAFGLGTLAAAGWFLLAFRVRPVIAGLVLAALALEPGYLFTFRVQFYLQAMAFGALLASVAWVETRRGRPSVGVAVGAGVLAGIACYGYFVFAFLVPVAAVHAGLRWRGHPGWRRLGLFWALGFAVGAGPYLLGLLLMLVATGGVRGLLDFVSGNLGALGVGQSVLSWPERLAYFADIVRWTIWDVGPSSMMLHAAVPPSVPGLRLVLLLAVPGLGLIWAVVRKRASGGLLVSAGFFAGTLVLFLTFGNRLWLHHAGMLLPALYVALGLAVSSFGRVAVVAAVLATAPLLAGNAVDRQAVFRELERTGGVGLASDAVERFAEDVGRDRRPSHGFFPDWGVFMPFVMVTSGRVPFSLDFSPEAVREVVCGGRDAVVAVFDEKGTARLDEWSGSVAGAAPERRRYAQRDGVPVLTTLRWAARGCS
ncbi:MAG: hypothetical protein NVSMB18_27470 [Acetobacteraceae bacterium]